VSADVVEIFPATKQNYALRIELFDNEIEKITFIDALTGGRILLTHNNLSGQLFVTPRISSRRQW
jgi:excinuclease UvrABC helicase subunit UvrB